jgi:pyrimidine-nucleoside phosphorylase
LKSLVDCVEQNDITDEEVAYLTMRLAESGDVIHQLDSCKSADIASTGGPSSLSTLLCPLYLRAHGYKVPKLAVPGRPAGGIDVLAQIPGYKIEFTAAEVNTLLRKSGYVHFLASRNFAPLDAALFSFRRQLNKTNIPALAIASLLAKKKAASVSLVGLDVRVALHGNFGNSMDAASQNASRFCRIATLLGCQALCFLSDANSPYQPFIGRGEALVAIFNILSGQADIWLRQHDDMCFAMVQRLAHIEQKEDCSPRPTINTLLSVFCENLEAQGASYEQFERYVFDIQNKHNLKITAPSDGFLNMNIELLRTVIVSLQEQTATVANPFSDPCGIILKWKQGTYVHKGEIIASVRCLDHLSGKMKLGLISALQISRETLPNHYFREVGHG